MQHLLRLLELGRELLQLVILLHVDELQLQTTRQWTQRKSRKEGGGGGGRLKRGEPWRPSPRAHGSCAAGPRQRFPFQREQGRKGSRQLEFPPWTRPHWPHWTWPCSCLSLRSWEPIWGRRRRRRRRRRRGICKWAVKNNGFFLFFFFSFLLEIFPHSMG